MGFFDKMRYISTMESTTLISITTFKCGRIHNITFYDYLDMGSITFEHEECENGMKDYKAYSLMDETDWLRSGTLAARYMFNPDYCK